MSYPDVATLVDKITFLKKNEKQKGCGCDLMKVFSLIAIMSSNTYARTSNYNPSTYLYTYSSRPAQKQSIYEIRTFVELPRVGLS